MSPPRTIHIVQGGAGEYSEWTTWSVAAYEKGQAARQHAERAQVEAARRKELLRDIRGSLAREKWIAEHPNRWDPDCPVEASYGYDDVDYTVYEVPFRMRLPGGAA